MTFWPSSCNKIFLLYKLARNNYLFIFVRGAMHNYISGDELPTYNWIQTNVPFPLLILRQSQDWRSLASSHFHNLDIGERPSLRHIWLICQVHDVKHSDSLLFYLNLQFFCYNILSELRKQILWGPWPSTFSSSDLKNLCPVFNYFFYSILFYKNLHKYYTILY